MPTLHYTKSLGKLLISTQPATSYHVVSGMSQNWVVITERSNRAVKSFKKQKEAILFAKQRASRDSGTVIIHNKSGQIRYKIAIGN